MLEVQNKPPLCFVTSVSSCDSAQQSVCVHTKWTCCLCNAFGMHPYYWAFPESYYFFFLPPQIFILIFALPSVGLARKLPVRLHWCHRSKLCPEAQSQSWTLELQTLSPAVAP